jgi:hypothetical protein
MGKNIIPKKSNKFFKKWGAAPFSKFLSEKNKINKNFMNIINLNSAVLYANVCSTNFGYCT